MGHLILPPDLISNLGPAVTSGRSILMYGPPGNGKSSISHGIRAAIGDKVYVPRAIEYSGQVISVYDPIVHAAAESAVDDPTQLRRTSNRYDNRYVYCERPSVITAANSASTCSTSPTTPRRALIRRPCSSRPPAASSSSTTLVARPSRRRRSSTAGSCRWKKAAISLRSSRREIHRALRHAGDLLHQLPPERDLRRRGLRRFFSRSDRRAGSGQLPQDLRHGRAEKEDAAG